MSNSLWWTWPLHCHNMRQALYTPWNIEEAKSRMHSHARCKREGEKESEISLRAQLSQSLDPLLHAASLSLSLALLAKSASLKVASGKMQCSPYHLGGTQNCITFLLQVWGCHLLSLMKLPNCARLGCSWWVQFGVPNGIRTMSVAQRWARRRRNSRMDIWICSITQLGPPSFSSSLIVIPLATKTPRHQKPCRVIWSDAEEVTVVLNSRRIIWIWCPM